jgi:hypothetical protein
MSRFWKFLGLGATIAASTIDPKDLKTQEALGHVDKVLSVVKPLSDAGLIQDPSVGASVDFLHTLIGALKQSK